MSASEPRYRLIRTNRQMLAWYAKSPTTLVVALAVTAALAGGVIWGQWPAISAALERASGAEPAPTVTAIVTSDPATVAARAGLTRAMGAAEAIVTDAGGRGVPAETSDPVRVLIDRAVTLLADDTSTAEILNGTRDELTAASEQLRMAQPPVIEEAPTPEQPVEPQQPSTPQQPTQPQQPSEPEQPSQPQQPTQPQQPGGGGRASINDSVTCTAGAAVTFTASGGGTVTVSVSGAGSGTQSGAGSTSVTVTGGAGTYSATATADGTVSIDSSWSGACS